MGTASSDNPFLFDPNKYHRPQYAYQTSPNTVTTIPTTSLPSVQTAQSQYPPYLNQTIGPSVPAPEPKKPRTDKAVDELAERFGIQPEKDEGNGPYLYGEKGLYSLLSFFGALVARVENLNLCPECGTGGQIEPGDYLCRACRNV